MTRSLARWGRTLTTALALSILPLQAEEAQAQEPAPAAADASGDGKPIWGYLAFGAAAIAILFVISLSARR